MARRGVAARQEGGARYLDPWAWQSVTFPWHLLPPAGGGRQEPDTPRPSYLGWLPWRWSGPCPWAMLALRTLVGSSLQSFYHHEGPGYGQLSSYLLWFSSLGFLVAKTYVDLVSFPWASPAHSGFTGASAPWQCFTAVFCHPRRGTSLWRSPEISAGGAGWSVPGGWGDWNGHGCS